MAVNVKMGVDLGNFTSGIKQGQTILKGLNAELKAADAEFKATGNAEQMMTQKSKTLSSQLNIQKGIVDQAKRALKEMDDAGIKPTDQAYQKLYATMMNAQSGMYEAQSALNALGTSAEGAAKGTDSLKDSVNSIGKKMSIDQVISGIDTITQSLENAARKAVSLGETIWNNVMSSAQWADDTATMAMMYGMDIDTFQRIQKLVTNGMDTSVEAIIKSQQKMKKGIGEGSASINAALVELGLATQTFAGKTGESFLQLVTEDDLDLFFRAGQAIMSMTDTYEQEAVAQKLFGRSWHELIPLFSEYKTIEEFNKALAEQTVVSEDGVVTLATLNDKVGELQGNFNTLKNEVMAQLAPALTEAANALNGLLQSVLEYLQTPEGKQMLDDLGTAVSGLFSDLGSIDPQAVVSGFTDVFNTVVGSIQWLVDNKDGVITALEAIVVGWGALKLTGGALDMLKLVNGLQSLFGLGDGAGGTGGVTAGGGVLGGMFEKIATIAGSTVVQQTVPFIADWFVHNTGIGQELFLGTKEKGSTAQEIQERGKTFWQDWQENVLTGWMFDLGENMIRFWDAFWKGEGPAYTPSTAEEADWRPSYQQGTQNNYFNPNMAYFMQDQEPVKIEAEPVAEEGAAADLASQVGTVNIPVSLYIPGGGAGGGGAGKYGYLTTRANGLPFVPYDNYLALLHKGEQVVPARQVNSRNYSSNLYVENMNMNNGMDAEGLASRIAAAQRRTMSGYGS